MSFNYEFNYPSSIVQQPSEIFRPIHIELAKISSEMNYPLSKQKIKHITVCIKVEFGHTINIEEVYETNEEIWTGFKNNQVLIKFYNDKLFFEFLSKTFYSPTVSCDMVFHNMNRIYGPVNLSIVLETKFWNILFYNVHNAWKKNFNLEGKQA